MKKNNYIYEKSGCYASSNRFKFYDLISPAYRKAQQAFQGEHGEPLQH